MRERPGADSLPCRSLRCRSLPGRMNGGWPSPESNGPGAHHIGRPSNTCKGTSPPPIARKRPSTLPLSRPSRTLAGPHPTDLPNSPGFGLESQAQHQAGVAQLVEQRIRNAKVGSSTLFTGTKFQKATLAVAFCFSGTVSALLASCCRSFRWAATPEQQGVGALPPLPTLKPSATPTCAGASPLIGTNLGPDPALRWKSHGNGTSPRHTPPTY